MLDAIKMIATAISTIAAGISIIIPIIIKLSNAIKEKKLLEYLPQIMEEAEVIFSVDNKTGEYKNNYVKRRMEQIAVYKNLKYNEVETELEIEKLISLSKGVNKNVREKI